jgi:hypothetical protein
VLEEAPESVSRDQLSLFIASALREKGRKEEAKAYFQEIYARMPDSKDVFNELFRFYYQERMQTELVELLADWTARHPEDRDIREAYQQLLREVPGLAPSESTETDPANSPQHLPDSGVGG